jgi:hypothetical protein
MKVIADFCLVPLGVGVSTSEYIAECERPIYMPMGQISKGNGTRCLLPSSAVMSVCMKWAYPAYHRRSDLGHV